MKAVFFDRDGVINRNDSDYYVFKIERFKFNEGIFETMLLFKQNDYKIFIISNQSGISKNVYTKNDVEILHEFIKNTFKEKKIEIIDIYYCPHHPDIENCLCRKPKPLMIEKAIARFQLDKNQCIMIGDSRRDTEAAEKAGITGYLVKPNCNILEQIQKLKLF